MSSVFIDQEHRLVVGVVRKRELREHFAALKAFMQRVEAGG